MNLVEALLSGDLIKARELMEQKIEQLFEEKLEVRKQEIVADYFEEGAPPYLEESNIMRVGRAKVIRVRVRGGKVQRRKKVSAVKGYTFRGGRMVRMTSREMRNRRMGARRAKIKRRGKMSQILRKRKISLRKRRALGVR